MDYKKQEDDLQESIKIHNLLPEIGIESIRQEIIDGLESESKQISPKYFYNAEGGALFEKITTLNEYYPTRCEKEILANLIRNLNVNFNNMDIIELGSGDASKISLIFNQLSANTLKTINYFAIDIDQSAIKKSIKQLTKLYNVNCTGIITDFYHKLEIPPSSNQRLFCFFGSTIGNFNPIEAETFIKQLGSIMKKGDALLLGADMIKDISVIERAYNDQQKVTEAFNKNILNTVNSFLETNFETSNFEHLAFYNTEKSRIEMHLKSLKDQEIKNKYASKTIKIKKGETIHTENSHKFNQKQLKHFGEIAKLSLDHIFSDPQGKFSLSYYVKK